MAMAAGWVGRRIRADPTCRALARAHSAAVLERHGVGVASGVSVPPGVLVGPTPGLAVGLGDPAGTIGVIGSALGVPTG